MKFSPDKPSWFLETTDHTATIVEWCESDFAGSSVDLGSFGTRPGRRLMFVDDGMPTQYRDALRDAAARQGLDAQVHVVPGGERSKTSGVLHEVLAAMDQFRLDRRHEPVLAVGGGAVLDVVGFASSVYRRGVPYIRVPTTVLAMVDAGLGIKTAVNFAGRKNLVGSFYGPRAVLICPELSVSNTPLDILAGLGEMYKLGVGTDAELIEELDIFSKGLVSDSASLQHPSDRLLQHAVKRMIDELAKDPHEQHLSRILDLGHTFSQVLEQNRRSEPFTHGLAVAADVNLTLLLSRNRELLSPSDLQLLWTLSSRLGFPIGFRSDLLDELVESLDERTSHRGGRQRVPLVSRVGQHMFVDDISAAEIRTALEELDRT